MTSIAERFFDRARLLALAVVPLLTLPWLGEKRELPRLVVVEVVGFLGLALAARAGHLRRTAWTRAAMAAAAVWLVASVAAPSPWRSFFGPYEGHFGSLALLGYLALAAAPPPRAEWPRWTRALALLGFGEALWALVQRARGGEATGSLGHIVFLAGFCMLAGAMALALSLGAERAGARLLWGLAFVACAAAIAATGRRGPLFGLIAGSAVVLRLSWSRTASRRLRLVLLGGAALAVVAVGLVPLRDQSTLFSRLEQLVTRSGPAKWDTAQRRLGLYRLGIDAFLEHPLLGNGFGSFRDRAAQAATTEGEVEISVHDLPLEMLASTGAVGGLALLALLVAWLASARRTLAGSMSPELAGAAGVAVAEAIFLLFNFDQPAMAAWAWLIAGWLLDEPGTEGAPRPGVALAAGLAAVVAILPLIPDAWAAAGVRAETAGDVPRAEDDLQTAVKLAPYECFYALRLVALERRIAPTASAGARIGQLERCLRLEPDSAFLHYHLGLAHADRATLVEAEDRAKALVELTRATELAPSVPLFHHALAQSLVSERDLTGALAELDAALALGPEPAEAAGYLNDRGNVLALLGRRADAAEAYRAALTAHPGDRRSQQNLEALEQRPLAPEAPTTR